MSKDYNESMVKSVRLVTNQLTDDELVAISMAGMLGTNPTGVLGYEKAKTLFTEQDGTRMHSLTAEIVNAICQQRVFGG